MTTYSFTVELSEQEAWSVEEALKFYLTPEAIKLREERPDLVQYAAVENVYRLVGEKRIFDNQKFTSSSSFTCSNEIDVEFIDNFSSIPKSVKDLLIDDVSNAILNDSFPDLQSRVLLQVIHSPEFKNRIFNELIERLSSDTPLITTLLRFPRHMYWFQEMVAIEIQEKQLSRT